MLLYFVLVPQTEGGNNLKILNRAWIIVKSARGKMLSIFYAQRVVVIWHSLLERAEEADSLVIFKREFKRELDGGIFTELRLQRISLRTGTSLIGLSKSWHSELIAAFWPI